MIVPAKCLAKAFDNKNGRSYFPGFVEDYDTENEPLNSLTTLDGKWIFQYPGHEGGPKTRQAVAPPPPVEKKVDKRRRPMTEEEKVRMKERFAAARAARKAKLEAA